MKKRMLREAEEVESLVDVFEPYVSEKEVHSILTMKDIYNILKEKGMRMEEKEFYESTFQERMIEKMREFNKKVGGSPVGWIVVRDEKEYTFLNIRVKEGKKRKRDCAVEEVETEEVEEVEGGALVEKGQEVEEVEELEGGALVEKGQEVEEVEELEGGALVEKGQEVDVGQEEATNGERPYFIQDQDSIERFVAALMDGRNSLAGDEEVGAGGEIRLSNETLWDRYSNHCLASGIRHLDKQNLFTKLEEKRLPGVTRQRWKEGGEDVRGWVFCPNEPHQTRGELQLYEESTGNESFMDQFEKLMEELKKSSPPLTTEEEDDALNLKWGGGVRAAVRAVKDKRKQTFLKLKVWKLKKNKKELLLSQFPFMYSAKVFTAGAARIGGKELVRRMNSTMETFVKDPSEIWNLGRENKKSEGDPEGNPPPRDSGLRRDGKWS